MIGKKLGDFEITEEIGKGGMGQVYKARQLSLDRDVAIKILPGNLSEVEEFRERFDIEAKAVASLMHENILQMYSKGVTDEGVHYFAMEYVDGEDLADKIKRGTVFSESEAVKIAIQVCKGLEAAWKKNIIHRDIKPSNIMIAKDGTVKIADFGLAKSLDATKKVTQTNAYMGTVAYTSPEQGEGKPLDHRTDIYSLGIVLYQLMTGVVPFTAETPSSVIYKHVYEAPPAPRTINPGISAQTEAVVLKAIAKKPEDRFQNAVDFREALESVSVAQPSARPSAVQAAAVAAELKSSEAVGVGTKRKPGSRAPVLIAAAVVIVLLAGSALYASKYGYFALLSKVVPIGQREERREAASEKAGDLAEHPTKNVAGADPVMPAPAEEVASVPGKTATVPPPVRSSDPGDTSRGSGGQAQQPAAARTNPPDRSMPPKRAAARAVLVVTSGESNIADIVESVIGRKLQERSIAISGIREIEELSERYGRHAIPLNALNRRPLESGILVYVSVTTMDASPLKFYGRMMAQYASTISIKVIDTATQKVINSPRSKTVNYTTLNMHDNIEEATSEMILELPGKIEAFWKG